MPSPSILFAQDVPSDAGSLVFIVIMLAIVLLTLAGIWATFEKAGKPGWASIVPIYNVVVLLEITGKPLWWILLFLIPIVGLIVAVLLYVDLAKSFGKGVGFGVGLALLPFIFFPLLGFGDAEYQGGI